MEVIRERVRIIARLFESFGGVRICGTCDNETLFVGAIRADDRLEQKLGGAREAICNAEWQREQSLEKACGHIGFEFSAVVGGCG